MGNLGKISCAHQKIAYVNIYVQDSSGHLDIQINPKHNDHYQIFLYNFANDTGTLHDVNQTPTVSSVCLTAQEFELRKCVEWNSDNDWNRKWNLSMKIIQTENAIEDARLTPHIINPNPTMAIF